MIRDMVGSWYQGLEGTRGGLGGSRGLGIDFETTMRKRIGKAMQLDESDLVVKSVTRNSRFQNSGVDSPVIRWPSWLCGIVMMIGLCSVPSHVCALPQTETPVDSPVRWPGFLGAGASPLNEADWPVQWELPRDLKWQTVVPGHGQSSPVLWQDLVFVTSVEGANKDQYHVLCLDAKTGEMRWQRTVANSVPVKNSLYVSRSAPTPVVDAERIVVFFESGDCHAWTHAGEPLWNRNLSADFGPFVAEFGLGASPCQSDSMVFVLLEHDGPGALVALNKSNGKTAWQAERSPRRSWASPALLQVGDELQVVVSSAGTVDGYQASSGKLQWSFSDIGGNTATTPQDLGNGRFLVAASGGRDGQNVAEARKSNCLLQVTKEGDDYVVNRQWVAEGATPSWASPIAHRGYAYWVNRVGVVYCVDMETGESIYSERTKQQCWATPLPVGDRIYFFGKDGLCTVLKAGAAFEILGESPLWNDEILAPEESLAESEETPERRQAAAMFDRPTLYGYAVGDGVLVVRIGHQMFALSLAE